MWFVNLLNLIALQCAIVANCHLSRKLKCLRSKSGTFSKQMGLLGSNPITTKCHCRRAKKNYLTRGQVKTEGGADMCALWGVYLKFRRLLSICFDLWKQSIFRSHRASLWKQTVLIYLCAKYTRPNQNILNLGVQKKQFFLISRIGKYLSLK